MKRLFLILVFLFSVTSVYATTKQAPPEANAESTAVAGAAAGAVSGSASNSNAAGGSSTSDATGGNAQAMTGPTTSTATNEGTEVTNTTETNTSQVVLVPNNNTENCLRVWGIAFGRNGDSGALGVPWRSKKCDFEQAADDAFAAGEHELGWYWKCQNPNLHGRFKEKGSKADRATKTARAAEKCHETMLKMAGQLQRIAALEKENERLRDERDFVQQERMIERATCEESKDRIAEACRNYK